MSHHLDYPTDESLDITDCYCFPGPTEDDGPRTVLGMNTSPVHGIPWNPNGHYELRLDLNGDLVEDITWRFTFTPAVSNGNQYVQIAQLTGADATNRDAPDEIITTPNAPTGQVLNLPHGIKAFAGKRRDPFFNFLKFIGAVLDTSVKSVILELPTGIAGTGQIHCWATTAYFDTGHHACRTC
jgi:hypothetical protein